MIKIKNAFVDFLIRLKDYHIFALGVIGAIILSKILIVAIHYVLWSGKISEELAFAGYAVPLLDASIVLFFVVAIITRLRDTTQKMNFSSQMLEKELAFQSAVGEVSEAFLTTATDISALAKIVLDKALSLTNSAHGYVAEVDNITGACVGHTLTEMMGEQCKVAEDNRSITFPKSPMGYNALWGHSLNSLEAFYTNEPRTHSAFEGCCPPGHVSIERFLSVPAISGGRLIGQIALANPKTKYTENDLNVIKRLAAIYAMGVDRKRLEADIRHRIREKETLLREIHHRVKNNLAIVSSLLALQASRSEDPAARDVLNESRQRVYTMALVHEKLYQTRDFASINFKDYITTMINEIISLFHPGSNRVATELNVEDIELTIELAIPCGLILNELLTNAMKYAFPDNRAGVLHVGFTRTGDAYTLTVRDNGVGLPDGFNYRETQTLGLQIVIILTGQLNGLLQVNANNGTEVAVSFKT